MLAWRSAGVQLCHEGGDVGAGDPLWLDVPDDMAGPLYIAAGAGRHLHGLPGRAPRLGHQQSIQGAPLLDKCFACKPQCV